MCFEPFFRGRSATAGQIQGSGLGLSLVKEAAEAHGGRVDVSSSEGLGSTFRISLPVHYFNRELRMKGSEFYWWKMNRASSMTLNGPAVPRKDTKSNRRTITTPFLARTSNRPIVSS
jgi:hypothetical protein